MNIYDSVLEKFLRYVKVDTGSSETSHTSPSTEKQKDLARMLYTELKDLGASDVVFDEKYCYVYAKIPGNIPSSGNKYLGFLAHVDTSPEVTDENVKPNVIKNFDGNDIVLSGDDHLVISAKQFPLLPSFKGKTLVTTDGSTLLGADDKAGVAEIMSMAEYFLTNPEIPHGNIAICFTPDEEIGEGVDHIDLKQFGADYAYTVDGGLFGELEYENFNAAAASITIKGVSVHPGDAKDKMINASLVAYKLNDMLPQKRPDNTEDYEGFFHLTDINGSVDYAEVNYIIRDHDMNKFLEKKQIMRDVCDRINEMYGNICSLKLRDQYYNMKEKIYPDNSFLIENAKEAIRSLGFEPIEKPIRGGTDGARLSYMGLPCPNLPTGGQNYHGRYEFACVEEMELIVKLLIKLASTSL